MDKKIFNNSRVCPKGDIEANWNKAVGFIPLDKEIIIYKPDENYSYARIKIGDGVTGVQDLPFIVNENKRVQPDYEQNDPNALDYIKNRPFYTEVKEGGQIPIEITILESDSGNEGGYFFAEYKGKFTPESILTVELDGKIYENLEPFTLTDDDSLVIWGNPYYADSTLTDNGMPFIFGAIYELTDSGADGYIECEIYSSNPDLSTFKISRIPQERLICDVNNIQEIIDSSNSSSALVNSIALFSSLNSIDITTDNIVTVTFNGKVYENLKLEKYESANSIIAGNKSLIDSSLPDTEEPFCLSIGLVEKDNVVPKGACGSSLTVDEYDWSDFSVFTIGGSIIYKKIDSKYLPNGLATEEYVDEKIDEIELPEIPTNYITTNTNQTNLSGTKEWTANGLVFSPGNNFKYSKEYVVSHGDYISETLIDKVELNWIKNFLIFSTIGKGDSNWQGDYYELSRKKVALYNKDGFNISDTYDPLGRDGIIGNTSGITIYKNNSAGTVIYKTEYCNKCIKYTQTIPSGIESDSYNIQLTFPTESGVLATQEWVNENVKLDLGNELILGKDTITSENQFYTLGTYTNTGITLEDNMFYGVVRTTTTYGRDYISFSHSNGTGDNETFGEPKSCKLIFPDGDGTIATQEYVGSKIEENNLNSRLPQEPGWKITRYVLNHSFKTYNNVDFYHEGFANFIEYESLADSTKHKIVADIHITSEETISEPSDIGIKVLTTVQVGNKWESAPLYVNNVFPEGFLDNTKYTNITVDKYQWITDITQDAIGRFNSNGSIGPVLYADRSNGFVPLVWGNGLELDTYNDGQPLIIGGKEIKVTYYDYYKVINNKKS